MPITRVADLAYFINNGPGSWDKNGIIHYYFVQLAFHYYEHYRK